MMSGKKFVCFVLDESGSMSACIEETMEGYKSYIEELKSSGVEVAFTLIKFNSSRVTVVHESVPIKDVPPLTVATYQPAACTPLYDAIGSAATSVDKMNTKGLPVLLTVLTDGLENASREYDLQAIKALVESKKKNGWTVAFIGAELSDVKNVAAGMGVPVGNTFTYTSGETKSAMRRISGATVSYVTGGGMVASNLFAEDDGTDKDIEIQWDSPQ